MTKQRPTPFAVQTVAACSGLVVVVAMAADEPFEPSWQLEADLAVVEPSRDAVAVGVSPASVDVDYDTMVGVGLRLEYQFTKALALELGALGASGFDVSVGGAENILGAASRIDGFTPVTLGLNFHLGTGSRADLYAGAFLAAIRYGDFTVETAPGRVTTSESADTDFGWGAIAGIGLPIGAGRWSLQANLRYVQTGTRVNAAGDIDESNFDPMILSIGFGYRF